MLIDVIEQADNQSVDGVRIARCGPVNGGTCDRRSAATGLHGIRARSLQRNHYGAPKVICWGTHTPSLVKFIVLSLAVSLRRAHRRRCAAVDSSGKCRNVLSDSAGSDVSKLKRLYSREHSKARVLSRSVEAEFSPPNIPTGRRGPATIDRGTDRPS